MAKVAFENVVKKYGDVTAVNNLNIDVADKEFLVLVGPSGCGKTTALRCLAGLEEITGGDIKIGDRVVNDVAPKDRDIAMVFQSYALYPHLSVYDNMAFGLKLRKVPKDALEPGCQTARGNACRDQQAASAPANHLHLCDPRSDGSHDHGKSYRGDQQGRFAAT